VIRGFRLVKRHPFATPFETLFELLPQNPVGFFLTCA
jgi:hypothetical protein